MAIECPIIPTLLNKRVLLQFYYTAPGGNGANEPTEWQNYLGDSFHWVTQLVTIMLGTLHTKQQKHPI